MKETLNLQNDIDVSSTHVFRNLYIRYCNLFLLSVIAFLLGIFSFYIFSPKYSQLLQIISIPVMIFCGYKISSYKIKNGYFKYVFVVYMLTNVGIITRIDAINYDQLKILLFSDFAFWPYLVPLVALIIRTPIFFNSLFYWIIRLATLFFLITIILWNTLKSIEIVAEQTIWIFSSGCGIVLLTSKYHSNYRKLVALSSILLALYISTLLARRNIMLTNINFVMFSFLLYFVFIRGYASEKLISIYISLMLLFSGYLFFKSKIDTDFRAIVNRASEDTREYVFTAFFADMEGDMWFGKGIDGSYFCPMTTEDETFIYRDIIECGYLQILLKGGILNLTLFLMILFPAAFLGIFHSNNIFSKACGMIVFLWLVDMIPYGLPNFSIRYILVWICVGACFDKRFRSLDEETLTSKLGLPGSKRSLSV